MTDDWIPLGESQLSPTSDAVVARVLPPGDALSRPAVSLRKRPHELRDLLGRAEVWEQGDEKPTLLGAVIDQLVERVHVAAQHRTVARPVSDALHSCDLR